MDPNAIGPFTSIGSEAEWVGAAGAFTAALVALGIAILGVVNEAGNRRRQDKAIRQAVIRGLLHGLQLFAVICEQIDLNPVEGFNTRVLNATIKSAVTACDYSLGQPFVDPKLLETALMFRSQLVVIEHSLAQVPAGADRLSANALAEVVDLYRYNLLLSKALLEKML